LDIDNLDLDKNMVQIQVKEEETTHLDDLDITDLNEGN